jgi:hypothetical protein
MLADAAVKATQQQHAADGAARGRRCWALAFMPVPRVPPVLVGDMAELLSRLLAVAHERAIADSVTNLVVSSLASALRAAPSFDRFESDVFLHLGRRPSAPQPSLHSSS